MDKQLQKLIDERQELIDKLCLEIVAVEEGMIKIPEGQSPSVQKGKLSLLVPAEAK